MAKRKRISKARFARAVLIGLSLAALLSAVAHFASRALERHTYALMYADQIKACADEYALSRYLVAAVIHCESGNDKNARSYRGALGLMQIMPSTGAWIAAELEVEDYSDDMLLEPAQNIRFGCWYLRYLSERYDDPTKVLAAYNAGPGNVEKWLNNPEYASKGRLTRIPFPETKSYVEKVGYACQKYEELYKKELG